MITTAVYIYSVAQGGFTFSFLQVVGTLAADLIIASSIGGSRAVASTR